VLYFGGERPEEPEDWEDDMLASLAVAVREPVSRDNFSAIVTSDSLLPKTFQTLLESASTADARALLSDVTTAVAAGRVAFSSDGRPYRAALSSAEASNGQQKKPASVTTTALIVALACVCALVLLLFTIVVKKRKRTERHHVGFIHQERRGKKEKRKEKKKKRTERDDFSAKNLMVLCLFVCCVYPFSFS
jgi:hypothetical protein